VHISMSDQGTGEMATLCIDRTVGKAEVSGNPKFFGQLVQMAFSMNVPVVYLIAKDGEVPEGWEPTDLAVFERRPSGT